MWPTTTNGLSDSLLDANKSLGPAKASGNASFARSAALLLGIILSVTVAVSVVILTLLPDLATLGLLAYCFGCRHGVDADHIAAIDNVTRRLVASGQRAMTVGIFFSFGHCTVVLLLCGFVLGSASATEAQLAHLAEVGGTVGPWVGAAVLGTIGVINLCFARDLHAQYQQRTARGHEHEIASLVGRCCPAFITAIDAPHKVFWIGLLFGLGLDTATEIALLTISALAHTAVPRFTVLLLPMLFAAGMALVDSVNGLVMLYAYEWAADNGPMQRLYFSLFLTVASAVLAIAIAVVEAFGALADEYPDLRAGCHGAPTADGEAAADATGGLVAAMGTTVWCGFWESMLWCNERLELVGLAMVVGFLIAICTAVLRAHRIVPSQSQIDADAKLQVKESLQRYVAAGDYIVRFE